MTAVLAALGAGLVGWVGGWCAASVLIQAGRRGDPRTSAEAYRHAREDGWPL